MGKKSKELRRPEKTTEASEPEEKISNLGWMVIAAGGTLVVIGFLVLSRTDSMGRNWASVVSPFLILGGYAAIAVGIFLPDRTPPAS